MKLKISKLIHCTIVVASTVLLRGSFADPTVGPLPGGKRLLPTGQVIRPVGHLVTFQGRPVDLALSPDHGVVYLKDNRGLVVVDAHSYRVRQELPFTADGSSMHGIVVTPKGDRVYATDSGSRLAEATVGVDGKLSWSRQISLPAPLVGGSADGCGIALTADASTAYVCLSRNNSLALVDLVTGTVTAQIPVGVAPYDVVLSRDSKTAFVSDWGGRHPNTGDLQAPSSGTPTVVDARGVGASGCVSVVDLAQKHEIVQIPTGLHPSDMEMSRDGRRLFVANANSDTVSIIDTESRRAIQTLSLRIGKSGSSPTGVAVSPDHKALYVALGGANAVAVVDIRQFHRARVVGSIPAGWYPGAVAVDGRSVYVANVKGTGVEDRGDARGFNSNQFVGNVQIVATSAAHKAAVDQPSTVTNSPVFAGGIEHVVYILKENRTYDQLFGDLKQANGDPKLCVYGREITPNHHALAEQFVLLDNYYCNGVISADGHSWATEGNVTDHLEKSFGGFARSYTFGDDPLTYSSTGFLWDDFLAHGKTFRNYGEMDYADPPPGKNWAALQAASTAQETVTGFKHSIGIANLRRYTDPDYPGWNLDIPDAVRADIFLRKFAVDQKNGTFPNLVFIYLPSDHTSATASGKPTPRAYVADNDLALGRIVEAISTSRFWKNTCIFVNEDDPQDGFDHVDGHRSICLVVSSYSARRRVVHQWCNQTSVLHTMERMLGLPPMNRMDASAPVMTACFNNTADPTSYRCLPSRVPLDETNPPASSLGGKRRRWARASDAMDWSKPDVNSDELLNVILWHEAKGMTAPYPSAHGAVDRR